MDERRRTNASDGGREDDDDDRRDSMAPTRVTCYFEVQGATRKELGMFSTWLVDVDVRERDSKVDVKKAICAKTGVKFRDLTIRLGNFNELLAFDATRMGRTRLGACGASRAVFEPKLLRAAEEYNNLGKPLTELPDWDPSKYDGRYDWEQKVKPEWEA